MAAILPFSPRFIRPFADKPEEAAILADDLHPRLTWPKIWIAFAHRSRPT